MTEIVYANIFKNISFGLYETDENLDYEGSKDSILKAFKIKYEQTIKNKLKEIGLVLKGFEYYSPKYYNFENDNLDTKIELANKTKLKQAILNNKNTIQEALDQNKSYDGYTAMTINTVQEELELLKNDNYEPDIIVIRELLDLECDKLDIYDNLIYEQQEDF